MRKDYSYRGGGAGSEECSLTEFAELHIQDWDTAMFEAERLLRWGETENDDDGEGVWEHYELIDRDGFIEQLRMILAESPDLADLAEFLGGRG